MNKFFEGISLKLLSIILFLTIVWGLFQSYFTSMLSLITAIQIERSIFLNAVFHLIVYVIFWEIIEYINVFFVECLCTKIGNNIYLLYFKKLHSLKLKKIHDTNTGHIAGLLMQMVEFKKKSILELINALISVVYILYVVFYVSKFSIFFSITIFLLMSLSLFVLILGKKFTENKLKSLTVKRTEQVNLFMDSINNISTIQKFDASDFITNKMQVLNSDNYFSTKQFVGISQIFLSLYKAINYMAFPACLLLVFLLKLQDKLPLVEFLSFLSVATVLLVNKVNIISEAIKDTYIWSSSQKKLDTILDNSFKDNREIVCTSIKKIHIQNAFVNYKDSVTVKIPFFTVDNGQFVCVYGESGQGKTTLLKIISGILETRNKLFINDVPTEKKIDLVYVSQDIEMLDMSLRENLTFGDENISDNDIIKIIDEIGMLEWLKKQKCGLDTKLGEKGAFVSTGQRQRLNIARGLLKVKDIYLFDEPTSNIDIKNEKLIINLIKKRLTGKTVIFVTHDHLIETICDKKYIFKNNMLEEII